MDRWLLAALLLGAVCCSSAADADNAEAAGFWNNNSGKEACLSSPVVCPAGQFAVSNTTGDCKPCLPGSFKAAAGTGCCERCKPPQVTFNSSNNQPAWMGASGCGCLKGSYKNTTLPNTPCLPCPKDSVADFGATACITCVAPQVPNTLRDTCVDPCPAGTMDWKGRCAPCTSFPKPAANPTPGGICKLCNVGTNTTDGVNCDSCLTGYFNTGNATNAVCNTCAANYYNPRWWSWRVQQQKRQASANNWNIQWPVFCKPCPTNTTSPANNTQGKCCSADKIYDDATNKCVSP